jgi:hypothetical protein
MKKIITILLTSVLLLSSCAITSNSDRFVGRLPSWISDTNLSQTTVEYVITSIGVDENEAYKNACNSFVDLFTNYLSIKDKSVEYKKSLIDSLAIKEYEIYNTARYFEVVENRVKGYFLFTANRESIDERLKVKSLNNESATMEIQELIFVADNYYQNNKDYKAFNSLIDAYIISRKNNIIGKNISADDILNRCISILNKSKIEVSNFESEQLSCTVEVTRQVGLFPPNVLDSKLKISYSSYNIEMKTYLETERIDLSSKMDSYEFVPKNKSVYTDGVLLLETDIDKALYKLEKMGYIDALKKLEKANKCYLLSYNILSEFKGKSIRLSVYENDLNEIQLSLIDVSNIVDVLEGLGAIVTVDELNTDYIEDYNIDSSIYDYQITFKNEVTEKLDEFKSIVRTAGSIEVANLIEKSVVYSSEPFETIANGDTTEEALKSAFNSFALKGIFLLKENF